ncbi:hypothetical protein ACFWDI_04870 [Streptomyces sp. NPDC060064]
MLDAERGRPGERRPSVDGVAEVGIRSINGRPFGRLTSIDAGDL